MLEVMPAWKSAFPRAHAGVYGDAEYFQSRLSHRIGEYYAQQNTRPHFRLINTYHPDTRRRPVRFYTDARAQRRKRKPGLQRHEHFPHLSGCGAVPCNHSRPLVNKSFDHKIQLE